MTTSYVNNTLQDVSAGNIGHKYSLKVAVYYSATKFVPILYLFVCIVLQQQYEFIHCGLSELVVCGETEVAAANLRIAVNNLKKMGEDGMTGFQKQMKVRQFMRLWVYNCINC